MALRGRRPILVVLCFWQEGRLTLSFVSIVGLCQTLSLRGFMLPFSTLVSSQSNLTFCQQQPGPLGKLKATGTMCVCRYRFEFDRSVAHYKHHRLLLSRCNLVLQPRSHRNPKDHRLQSSLRTSSRGTVLVVRWPLGEPGRCLGPGGCPDISTSNSSESEVALN